MTHRPTFHASEQAAKSLELPPVQISKGSDPYRISAVAIPPSEEDPMAERLTRNRIDEINLILSDRDKEILSSLQKCKFLLTRQIQRLHIFDASTQTASLRATARELKKLKGLGLVTTLERRIGGVRAGSNSFVWHITEGGERLLSRHNPEDHSRRRYLEPSLTYLRHTLAISECYVQLAELCRSRKNMSLQSVEWEPECWRPYNKHGKILQLKPDMFAITKCDNYEDRWFIEMDLSTESPAVILDKCERYRDYYRSGLEQKQYGVFPLTVWIVPDEARKKVIQSNIRNTYSAGAKIFAVITPNEFESLVTQELGQTALC